MWHQRALVLLVALTGYWATKPKCDQPNEFYSNCYDPCPPQTCRTLIDPVSCTANVSPCRSGCRCICGYYRNVNGRCVSKNDCLRCKNPHEFYACGGACDNVCATLSQQNQTNCPIVNIKCNEMCYCQEGYARNKDNVCVPFSQCERDCQGCNGDPNAVPGCGVNCGKLCSQLDKKGPFACPAYCKENGCDCKKGYYLNEDTGKCVLPCQCPCRST